VVSVRQQERTPEQKRPRVARMKFQQ